MALVPGQGRLWIVPPNKRIDNVTNPYSRPIDPMRQSNTELFGWDFAIRDGQVGGTIATGDTPALSFDPTLGLTAGAPAIDTTKQIVTALITSGTVTGVFQCACTIINSAGETLTREFPLLVE